MKRKKRKLSGSDKIFFVFLAGLLIVSLIFGIRTAGRLFTGTGRYQSVVSLEGLECGEDFEEKLQKIQGLRSFTPVLEVPARLRAEGYTMEAALLGVELDILDKRVSRSQNTSFGAAPVLLLGEGSLGAMTDRNGHRISEEKQKELLERYGEIQWQFCLAGEEEGEERWKPCLVAGTLSLPDGEIYLPYSQAEAIVGASETTKFLLTVEGKENYERALGYFGESSGEEAVSEK